MTIESYLYLSLIPEVLVVSILPAAKCGMTGDLFVPYHFSVWRTGGYGLLEFFLLESLSHMRVLRNMISWVQKVLIAR
jgi:hypothetical protein